MSTHAPLVTVKNAYRAWAEGDVVELLCALDPEVRWHQDDRLDEAELVGRGAIADRIKDVLNDFRRLEVTPLRWTAQGRLVAVTGQYTGEGRATGFQFEAKFTHLWGVKDGLGVEIGLYRTPATALRELDRYDARRAARS